TGAAVSATRRRFCWKITRSSASPRGGRPCVFTGAGAPAVAARASLAPPLDGAPRSADFPNVSRSTHTMSITNSRSVAFSALPDEARLWIFASPDPITGSTAEKLIERVDGFLEEWHAHGHPVVGSRDWRHDHFVLVAADEAATGVSGCSTDALFRIFKQAEKELDITLLDGSLVWCR